MKLTKQILALAVIATFFSACIVVPGGRHKGSSYKSGGSKYKSDGSRYRR